MGPVSNLKIIPTRTYHWNSKYHTAVMSNDDVLRIDIVTAHPHDNSWDILTLNIHKPTLGHLQYPLLTLYNPYWPIREWTIAHGHYALISSKWEYHVMYIEDTLEI